MNRDLGIIGDDFRFHRFAPPRARVGYAQGNYTKVSGIVPV